MTTPLIMLTLLMAPYGIALAFASATKKTADGRGAAAIGAVLLFLFTGAGHFIETAAMSQMLPNWIPFRELLVYATGLLELAIAIGFVAPSTRRPTGMIAIALLILFFPINVYASLNHIQMGGHAWGPVYLLIRGPLQGIILLWVYWFTVRKTKTDRTSERAV